MNTYNRNRRRGGFRAWLLLIIPVIIGLISGVVMLLWNAVVAPVLHVSVINFWQAAGLFILSKLLFGGFGRGNRFSRGGPSQHMREKFMSMTAEEREKMKAEWKERCERWKRNGR